MGYNPEQFSGFYTNNNLGFDLKLVQRGYTQFKKYFRGISCLELGPATGYMTKNLVTDFQKVTVVEGSRTLLEQIPNYPNIVKHNTLFEEFETNDFYDTIILNHVLEHIENPVALLKRIKKWMNPNAILIVGVPNSRSFHRLAAVKMGLLKMENELNERDKELGHYRVYDMQLLRKHVKSAGYKIIGEGGIFLKFLSNNQIEKFLNTEVVDAYFELGNDFKENSAEIFVVLEKLKNKYKK